MARASQRNFGLDCLRCLACLLVVISHFSVMLAARHGIGHADLLFIPSDVGLAIFFALSGFLIGNMLLDILDRGDVLARWKNFAARRLLRVLPAYLAWLLVLAVCFPGRPPFGEVLRYAFLLQNFAWPMPPGNWYGVSWSLAVEVWFYLSFSAIALGAAVQWGRRGFALVLAAFLLVPLLARASMPVSLPWDEWNRKIVLLRLDAIGYGVGAALLMRQGDWMDRQRGKLCMFGLALIAGALYWWVRVEGKFSLDHPASRTIMLAVFVLAVAMVLPAALRISCRHRFVVRVVAWFSDATYPIYLVHLSVLIWALDLADRKLMPLAAAAALAAVATLAVAAASLHGLERPILASRPRYPGRPDGQEQEPRVESLTKA